MEKNQSDVNIFVGLDKPIHTLMFCTTCYVYYNFHGISLWISHCLRQVLFH